MFSQRFKVRAESFQDFSMRFQLSEDMQGGEKAIIFFGNTRAGKSTLASAAAGSKMELTFNKTYSETYLHPVDLEFADVVRDTAVSVTETPNFWKRNGLSFVDMPGNADNSRIRQLINFQYIKEMASKFKKVHFLIVLKMNDNGDHFTMLDREYKMLDSFANMFPNCSEAVSIIINQYDSEGNLTKDTLNAIKGGFKMLIKKNVKNEKYFQLVGLDRVHVVVKPGYKVGPNGQQNYTTPYPQISAVMRGICQNKQLKMVDISVKTTQLNIFKEGDNKNNDQINTTLDRILTAEFKGLTQAQKLYQQIFIVLLEGVLKKQLEKTKHIILDKLNTFLAINELRSAKKERRYPQQYKGDIILAETRLMDLFLFMCGWKRQISQTLLNYEEKGDQVIKAFNGMFGYLIFMARHLFGVEQELQKKLDSFYAYTIRRLQETYFIHRIISKTTDKKNEIKQIYNVTKLQAVIQEIDNIPGDMTTFKNIKYLFERMQDLVNYFLTITFKRKASNQQTQMYKNELIKNLNNVKKLYQDTLISADKTEKSKGIARAVQKMTEIELEFALAYQIVPGSPNAKGNKNNEASLNKQIKQAVVTLLKKYVTANRQYQFKIATKIAALLLSASQYKLAIGLFLYLEIYDEVLRLLDLIFDKIDKAEAVEWCLQFSGYFNRVQNISYFERCLQKGKRFAFEDAAKFMELENRLVNQFGTHNDKVVRQKQKLKSASFAEKVLYWQMGKIDEQIAFLSLKFNVDPAKKNINYPIIARKYRQK